MIDMSALQMWLAVLTAWLDRQERNALGTGGDPALRSIKEECLNRIIPLGERHLRRAVHEFVEHRMFPWKEPKERIPLAVRQIHSFLKAHRSA